MAPKKTTGTGKPAITQAEKAAKYKLTISEYQNERVPITTEMRLKANGIVGTSMTGKKLKPGDKAKYFEDAWIKVRADTLEKYGKETLDRLKINYKKPPKTIKGPKKPKAKKSDTGKKGAARKSKA